MHKKYFQILILTLFLALIATACSHALNNDESEKTLPQDLQPNPTKEETLIQSALQITNDENMNSLVTTPQPSPKEDIKCEDPFDGETPNFPTFGWKTDFCQHSIPYSELFSGGPPRDVIPPIDSPKFVSVSSANEWIENREPVIIFGLGEDFKAYPLQILIWHEIVNDIVDQIPVAVTFCPLCNTALVFERPIIDGEYLTFGTSGNLRNSDLVMWDRQTESWWQQFSGEAIVGSLTSTHLSMLPSAIIAWEDFVDKYPDGKVLSRDTGFQRNYGKNPYTGYDNIDSFPFLFAGKVDNRLPPMARVAGIMLGDNAKAFSLENLRDNQVINDVIGDTPFVIFWKSGTASAVDKSSIADGNDVGSTGVFQSTIDGETLVFLSSGNGAFADKNTGSTWDILGEAVSGPLKGTLLKSIPHHDTFWFAWAAFVPPSSLEE